MLQTLKKNWFVLIIAIVFLGGIVYFISDSFDGVVSAKKVDGKDIVFSVGETNYSADELYDELEGDIANSLLTMLFEQSVIEQTVELTEDQITDANLQAQQLQQTYKAQFGDLADGILDSLMQSIGFESKDSLPEYFKFMTARQQVLDAYYKEHAQAFFEEFNEKHSPRLVSHILVRIDDFDNITDEEQQLMDDVDEGLATGGSFEDVARTYSEDGSAENGGSLGYSTKNSNLVPEFLEAMLELDANETSEWVETEYGFHLIRVDATSFEDLSEDQTFLEAFNNEYPELVGNAIWELAETLEIDYHGNEEYEEMLKATLGVKPLEGDQ